MTNSSPSIARHKNGKCIEKGKSGRSGGLILFIDDDQDEHVFFENTINKLKIENAVKYFQNGVDALDFLRNTNDDILLIISDINMPKMGGLELKKRIEDDAELNARSIPFIYHSNFTNPSEVRAVFTLNIQGFIKKGDYSETETMFKAILYFWSHCIHPRDLV